MMRSPSIQPLPSFSFRPLRSKRSRHADGDGAGIEPAFGERVITEEHGAAQAAGEISRS